MTRTTLVLLSSLVLLPAAACGKKGASEAPPPAKPASGSPMAFEVTKVTPGADHTGAIKLRGYNFGDKTIGQYLILMRYTDAAGKPLKVKVGTPFEKDTDFWSMSGNKYKCAPKHWCDFEVDHLDVPTDAVKAEVVAGQLTALGPDGMKFEDKPLYDTGNGMDWPK